MALRYLDSDGVVEKFVGFLEVADTTGETLANKIWNFLIKLGLNPLLLRGQRHDGASNMACPTRGVAARILERNPLALFTHCSNHILNLVIVKSCSILEIRNMFGTVQNVAVFFGEFAKRMKCLQDVINSNKE